MPNLEWQAMRDEANTEPCPHCRAHPGTDCRNPLTGSEIALPAHTARSKRATARKAARLSATQNE